MPIYEFQCTQCRHLFEEFLQKVPVRPRATCPECGARAKKVISSVGIVFKGAGFYVTDSRTGPTKDTAKPAAKAEDTKAGEGKAGDSGGTPAAGSEE